MKNIIALFVFLASGAPGVSAQTMESVDRDLRVASAAKENAPKDASCRVCWDSSFTPLNEKAKTVKAWEEKKTDVSAARGVVGIVALGAIFSPRGWQTLQEGQQKIAELTAELAALRAKAEALGGLEVQNGVVTKIKLVKGVDYKTGR